MTIVVSPHCDDAVLACGDLLACNPGTLVVTVFAGRQPCPRRLQPWDADAGFRPGDDAMEARRREDAAALECLGATPRWLDWCDAQYGTPAPVAAIAAVLAGTLERERPDAVVVPLGLFHSDHVRAHEAALAAVGAHTDVPVLAYEDALYRRYGTLLAARLAALRPVRLEPGARSPDAAPRLPPRDAAASEAKRAAVACYVSQLHALATPGRPGHADAFAPEGYWRLRGR